MSPAGSHGGVELECPVLVERNGSGVELRTFFLSPRHWTGPFAGRLKSNENL